jgi:hypothetical protein
MRDAEMSPYRVFELAARSIDTGPVHLCDEQVKFLTGSARIGFAFATE